jgi:uncharacterized protein YbjT (DUF2867 family)
MQETRVLVAGASGPLGGAIARKLLAAGVPVRALGRHAETLQPLAAAGAEIAAVDLLDLPRLTEACRGIGQIVATASNNMGSGATSPAKIDLTAYQNLCAAARNARVRRLVYTSFRGIQFDEFVDIFRIKWYIEDAIKRSGVPYVIMRPSAFADIWVDLVAGEIKKKGSALIFGDGTCVGNYITVDDVAEFAVRILAHEEIVNETIELGGPSDVSMNDLASLLERRLGASGKRRHVPVFMMTALPPLVRPFNEVAARLMTLGRYTATRGTPFPGWKTTADRFGVAPKTIDDFVEAWPR